MKIKRVADEDGVTCVILSGPSGNARDRRKYRRSCQFKFYRCGECGAKDSVEVMREYSFFGDDDYVLCASCGEDLTDQDMALGGKF